jgi:hypothetical protein
MKMNLNKFFKNKLIRRAVLLFILDSIFFGLIDPNKVNSLFLLVGFILLGFSIYTFMRIIMFFLNKMGFKIKNGPKIAGFTAGVACLLLVLQSIGQLSIIDVSIILPMFVLLYLYFTYIRPKSLE